MENEVDTIRQELVQADPELRVELEKYSRRLEQQNDADDFTRTQQQDDAASPDLTTKRDCIRMGSNYVC